MCRAKQTNHFKGPYYTSSRLCIPCDFKELGVEPDVVAQYSMMHVRTSFEALISKQTAVPSSEPKLLSSSFEKAIHAKVYLSLQCLCHVD